MSSLNPISLDRLIPVAAEQDAFVTAGQAGKVGVSYSELTGLCKSGHLERLARGVYRVAIGVPVIPRVPEWLYVKYLELDGQRLPWEERSTPRVVASHETAADVLGIGTLPADIASFTSVARYSTSATSVAIRTAPLPVEDWSYYFDGRLPVTRAARTIVDLALIGTGRDYVERALTDALRMRLTDGGELSTVLQQRRQRARSVSVAWLSDLLSEIE